MKKLTIVLLFIVSCKLSNAQVAMFTHFQQKDTTPVSRDTSMKDYVAMQAGQMILLQHEKVSRLTKDMKMKNGIIVKADGTVQMSDGRTIMLKEGDRVYLNGMIEGLSKPFIN